MCPVSTPSCCARGCIAWMARAAGGFTYSRTRSRAPGPLGDRRGDRDTGNLKTVRKGQLEDANQDRDDDVCLYDSTLCAPVAGPDYSLDEVIDSMKRYGYSGLEARVEWGHKSGIEATLTARERKAIKDRMAAEKLEICCVATSVRMADPDGAAREKHIADLHTYIDLAGDLSCPLVRTFGGPQSGRSTELAAAVAYTAEGYGQCVEHAAERGVTILMETHDDWSNTAAVRAVIETVNHPSLKCLWDVMHPQRMLETVDESFAAIGQHTLHVHAHDGDYDSSGKLASPAPDLGDGIFDHEGPWRLLTNAGYEGYFSIEVIHAPGSDHDAEHVLKQYSEAFGKIRAAVGAKL